MIKRVFFFLGILTIGLPGCFEPGENIQNIPEIAAIVGFDYDMLQPVLIIPGGEVLAPELTNKEGINYGDAVIAAFIINHDRQPFPGYLVASELEVFKINKTWPQGTPGGVSAAGDFNDIITDMAIYSAVEHGNDEIVFFCYFVHTAPPDHIFEYELTYDTEDDSDMPSVYIRAKISGQSTTSPALNVILHAFDMTYLYTMFKQSGKSHYRIMYNAGGQDGEESFKFWNDILPVP